jgi:hypothetical protein
MDGSGRGLIKAISRKFRGGTEENHMQPLISLPVSFVMFEEDNP